MLLALAFAAAAACPTAACAALGDAAPADTASCPPSRGAYEASALTRPRRSARDTLLEVTVCLVAGRGQKPVGSYHGELLFDSLQARVVRVERGPGGMRIENPGQPGKIAFAGAAVSGFEAGVVFRAILRLTAPATVPGFRLSMLEVFSVEREDVVPRLAVLQSVWPPDAGPPGRQRGSSRRPAAGKPPSTTFPEPHGR